MQGKTLTGHIIRRLQQPFVILEAMKKRSATLQISSAFICGHQAAMAIVAEMGPLLEWHRQMWVVHVTSIGHLDANNIIPHLSMRCIVQSLRCKEDCYKLPPLSYNLSWVTFYCRGAELKTPSCHKVTRI